MNGDPLVGATLTIYDAGTTTPTAIFKDAALGVSCTNPTSGSDVADAGGWFPQIFAAEGAVVDITLKDSAGVTVKTYEDVTFVGSDTGDFARTVSGNGRVKITGSAGSVLFQAGDPANDNTGGTLVIEGWAGSQLDSLTLDAAAASLTGTVDATQVRQNGKRISSVVYTTKTAFSAASQVNIALPNSPAGVTAWRIRFFDLITSVGGTFATMNLRFSYDNGSTYKSGGSDYAYGNTKSASGGTPVSTTDDAATEIQWPLSAPTANQGAFALLEIMTQNSGSGVTNVLGTQTDTEPSSSHIRNVTFSGQARGNYGRATHGQFAPSSGTITGSYIVEPIFGTGEA